MSTASEPIASVNSWDAGLTAIEAPLRFASRADFAHVDRVKDLEATLLRGAQKLRQLQPTAEQLALIDGFCAALPKPNSSRPQRQQQLQQCVQLLAQLRHSQRVAPSPAPPVARAAAPKTPKALAPPVAPARRKAARGITPESPIQFLSGVGPKVAELLAKRHLHTVGDLLRFLPRRYQGRSGCDALSDLVVGMVATVEADVQTVAYRPLRGRRTLEVILTDGTGAVHLMWFRVPGRGFADQFVRGQRVRASGEVKRFGGRMQIVHPEITLLDDATPDHTPEDELQPLYLDIEGLPPKQLRRLMAQACSAAADLVDPLPPEVRQRRGFVGVGEALVALHAPAVDVPLDDLLDMRTPWQQRLIYDELLLLQLAVLRARVATTRQPGHVVALAEPLPQLAASLLPFSPTGAQNRSLADIDADLRRPSPMQRLVQGDVGSGKTAVALTAAAAVARAGLQTALMAPTELLAEQHARTALKILTPHGVRVALLTGTIPAAERRRTLQQLREGTIDLVVGTHALIQDDVVFKALALGIIDEQHRFGVLQRARLCELGQQSLGAAPHTLVMTATPIPRTLALTVYGDLDVSIIDELPPGRTPIQTRLFRDKQRESVYAQVRDAVAAGRQAYVVFPLVEESDKESMAALRDATSSAAELAAGPLAGLRLGLLHGRLSADEKDAVMRAFAANEIDVLVATTVVEVGIDVPNATVMVIEHAERFGLSQLHQLRGRVGRGSHASQCLLLMRFRPSDDAWRRLAIMEQTNDGFRIAEEDLAIRGPGDFMGTRQAGLPMLTLANLARDGQLLVMARDDARQILQHDPDLQHPHHHELARLLADQRLRL